MTDAQNSPTERNDEIPGQSKPSFVEQAKTKQFWIWVVTTAVAFAVVVTALQALQVSVIVAFIIGIFFDELTDPFREWLVEWELAEREKEVAEA